MPTPTRSRRRRPAAGAAYSCNASPSSPPSGPIRNPDADLLDQPACLGERRGGSSRSCSRRRASPACRRSGLRSIAIGEPAGPARLPPSVKKRELRPAERVLVKELERAVAVREDADPDRVRRHGRPRLGSGEPHSPSANGDLAGHLDPAASSQPHGSCVDRSVKRRGRVELVTQTAPSPAAMPFTPRPTRIRRTIRFEAGSILTTVSSRSEVTQTAPSPAATAPGTNGRATFATTRFDAGSIRQMLRPKVSPATQIAPSPTARPSNDSYAERRLVRSAGTSTCVLVAPALTACLDRARDPTGRIGEPDALPAGGHGDVAAGIALQLGDEPHSAASRVERDQLVFRAVPDEHRAAAGGDTRRAAFHRDDD